MGERPDTVLSVGCPSSDIARTLDRTLTPDVINGRGSGATIDPTRPYLLVIFHPTTTEFGAERDQMEDVLEALRIVRRPTILLWPNIDAGSNHVSKAIRQFRDRTQPDWLRLMINFPPEIYLNVLANAACAIGNSSSFVRDASYFGTPVVLVGSRQDGRETAAHVAHVTPRANEITSSIRAQLAHGRYSPSTLYGDGFVSERIAQALADLTPYVQKRLHYAGCANGHCLEVDDLLEKCHPGAATLPVERVGSCASWE
jgi:UDP-N-acetylglucosamine 2-epimerase